MVRQNRFSHPGIDRLEQRLKKKYARPVRFEKPGYDPVRVASLAVSVFSLVAIIVILLT